MLYGKKSRFVLSRNQRGKNSACCGRGLLASRELIRAMEAGMTGSRSLQIIADHCMGQCIYCAISEARFGGIRNFHIEHFRPKAKFSELENDINNLYLACAICNVLKCDDWPAEPTTDHSIAAYPDPSVADYNSIFEVSSDSYGASSTTIAGTYLVERLLLNRAQLILERRLLVMTQLLEEFEKWVGDSMSRMTKSELKSTMTILLDFTKVKTGALQARPYQDVDTKRAVKTRARRRRSRS